MDDERKQLKANLKQLKLSYKLSVHNHLAFKKWFNTKEDAVQSQVRSSV